MKWFNVLVEEDWIRGSTRALKVNKPAWVNLEQLEAVSVSDEGKAILHFVGRDLRLDLASSDRILGEIHDLSRQRRDAERREEGLQG